MFKKVMCYLFTLALLVAIAVVPVSAESENLVLDVDYGNVSFKGSSKSEGALPIKNDYADNLTLELYVKINDFDTPTVIAGAWGNALHAYAIWCAQGTLYFSSADTNGNNSVSFDASVTADWEGKWLHVIGIKNGAENTIYCCPEGSETYVEKTVSRTTNRIYTDAPEVIINGAETQFEGAGDFVLGTVRLYDTDMSDNFEDMRIECEDRLAAAGNEQPPSDNPSDDPSDEPSEEPSENPSESPSNDPTDNSGNNNGSSTSGTNNSDKVNNATTFDLGIVSLAAVALSSMVAVKKRK